MRKYIQIANTLVEALPYIRRFYGKTVVIKYGGAAMVEESLKSSFAIDVALMKYVGINPVIVHGGGPQISEFLARMNIPTEFKHGQRVTDAETMDVVEMVLVGKVNKEIVALINREGGNAVGLSGKDGGLIRAKKLHLYEESIDGRPPELIDLGMVGEVIRVDPSVIGSLEGANFIPVIAPVGVGDAGETYNINADSVAAKLAQALGAVKLILITDVAGLMDNAGRLVSSLNLKEARRMLKEEAVSGGMIPKLACCVDAVDAGVEKAHILDGHVEHVILLELFTDSGVGTEVVP